MFLLYNILLTLLAPLWAPYVYLKARRRKEQPNWAERQGKFPFAYVKGKHRIWVHAVSVGEVVAAMPILREIRKRLPSHEIVLSVTTSSGHQTARDKASDLYDHLIYFPIDVARFQLAALQTVRPDAVVVMETELWMNFLWAAKVMGARTMLVNGRISDRAYPTSLKVKFYYKALFRDLDRCLVQTDLDAERMQALGFATPEVLGNCKFDQAIEGLDADPAEWRLALGLSDKPVIVVGSTRGREEEDLVLDALGKVGFDKVSVVFAPRHIERAGELAAAVKQRTGGVALRSAGETGPVLVLDTYGELAKIYSVADIVIIGGGFENLGGQNIIQPLAHGKPVLHGPHMQNFRDVSEQALRAGASLACSTSDDLATEISSLINDRARREKMGAAAKMLISDNAGASVRYGDAIVEEVAKAKSRKSPG